MVGVDLGPFSLDHGVDCLVVVLVLLDEVGDDDGGAPADAGHAVHQHIAGFPMRVDELEGLLEVGPDIGVGQVSEGYDEVLVDFVFLVARVAGPADGDDCLDAGLCIYLKPYW